MPLADLFPNAASGEVRETSEADGYCNCVGWALEERAWWEPCTPYRWPDGAPREDTVEAYSRVFEMRGYERCEDPGLEEGFEKVVIYGSGGGATFEHVARQLPTGAWTSKLGFREDVEHRTLETLEGPIFGTVAVVLRRRR